MENDWDLQLSHQIDHQQNLIQQKQFEPDLMLQPITTQQNFKIDSKHKLSSSPIKKQDFNNDRQIEWIQQQTSISKHVKDNQKLAEQAKKFRQYLNDKVEQLRKSKQSISQSPSPQPKSKTNNLRKIINRQEIKQNQNNNSKHNPASEKNNHHKPNNIVNKTSTSINKPIQPSHSSVGAYKSENNKKQENQKRFSNSHSNLVKNLQKKDHINAKNTTAADIKKSMNLDQNSKSPKLPELTPKLKIPFPTKNQPTSVHDRKDNRKKTIDSIHAKQRTEKQRRKTPESKGSFRIKRTSNVQPNTNQINVDIQKTKQVSLKMISKQKESPVHQSKNKKIREEFMKLNQEEKKIQQQILKHHQQTRKVLDGVMKKYQLSTNAFEKYGIKKQAEFPSEAQNIQMSPVKKQIKQSRIQKPSQKQINAQNKTQSPLKRQERKNTFLEEQLEKINNLLKAKEKEIKKSQAKVEKNHYIQFLRQMPQDILEEPEQDQADVVEQLPPQSRMDPKYDMKEFSSTYSSVMTEMKNKKWGLKQRITFETHRQQPDKSTDKRTSRVSENISSSNKKIIKENSRLPDAIQQEENYDPYSKIQVNSRLRNLLLD